MGVDWKDIRERRDQLIGLERVGSYFSPTDDDINADRECCKCRTPEEIHFLLQHAEAIGDRIVQVIMEDHWSDIFREVCDEALERPDWLELHEQEGK